MEEQVHSRGTVEELVDMMPKVPPQPPGNAVVRPIRIVRQKIQQCFMMNLRIERHAET